MKYTLEQKFQTLCQITRASHFEWRETFKQMFPDLNTFDAVIQYWKIVGHDTAKAFLKKVDKNKPLAPQIAEMIVNSSLAMGETATIEHGDKQELKLVHHDCPWYHWHKKFDALSEDQPGCDCWFKTIVNDFNKAMGSNITVETLSSLPNGDNKCVRIFKEE